MKTNPRSILWICIGALGLIVVSVGVFFWSGNPRSIPDKFPTLSSNTTPEASPSPTYPTSAVIDPLAEAIVSPQLPPVTYPSGSVGQACGVNEFPPYHWYFNLDTDTWRSLKNNPFYPIDGSQKVLEVGCNAALTSHLYSINPYLWGAQDEKRVANRAFSFIVIDNPLTFERIFTDPAGDFARVQDALARPECHLSHHAESNWKLKETCHAAAILNYALITRFCFNDEYQNGYANGVQSRTHPYYSEENNPTPEQDRRMWIQLLEEAWVEEKCRSLDPNLNFHSELHAELRQQIQALQPKQYPRVNLATLIELAARLGDAAAALTAPTWDTKVYSDEGYKYGFLAGWFTNKFEPTDLFVKYPPTVDRLRGVLSLFSENLIGKGAKSFDIDHKALVQHLCTPPYYDQDNEQQEPSSCRTVVTELRQEDLHPTTLDLLATFEDVAMRLDVYE